MTQRSEVLVTLRLSDLEAAAADLRTPVPLEAAAADLRTPVPLEAAAADLRTPVPFSKEFVDFWRQQTAVVKAGGGGP